MDRGRSRAAIAVLALLLVASSQGCGSDETGEGPPFEPGDIQGPESLLITDSDIEAAHGSYTPYGAVLRWFQALQQGDVEEVRKSYVTRVSSSEARRQIHGFQPRFSQPIDPSVKMRGKLANLQARVRSANPLARAPGVVSVRDFTTHFHLMATDVGWRVRPVSYRNYSEGRQKSRLAVR